MQRPDVVVVGARAGGAGAALLLARLGHDVVLVDRAVFPADTPSTHQIARLGVVALHRWGLLPTVLASGAPPIRQVRLVTGWRRRFVELQKQLALAIDVEATALAARPVPGRRPLFLARDSVEDCV